MAIHTGVCQGARRRLLRTDGRPEAGSSLALGGEIVISGAALSFGDAQFPRGSELVDLGEVTFRGMHGTEQLYGLERPAKPPRPARLLVRPPLPLALATEPDHLVGHANILPRMQERWASTVGGQRSLILVTGEAIGKTTLLASFAARCIRDGAAVVYGRCDEGLAVPYQPFIEAMGAAAPWLRGDGITTSGGTAHVDTNSLAKRARHSIGSRRNGLSYSCSTICTGRIVRPCNCCATCRGVRVPTSYSSSAAFRETDLERGHLLADLTGDPAVTCVQLQGLTAPDVASLVVERGSTGLGTSSPSFIEQLRVVTNGNPFFIDQVLRHLRESGADSDNWREAGVPDEVRDVISRRLARMSDAAKALLVAASVHGDVWDFDTVAEAAGLPSDDALNALDEALAARVITPAGAVDEPRYSFVHALVREALYADLSVPRRQRLHVRIAALLEERFDKGEGVLDATSIAMHYEAAGDAANTHAAVTWLVRAGDDAEGVFAFEDAARHWQAAIERLRRRRDETDNPEVAALLERLAATIFASGSNPDHGVAALEEALVIYEQGGDAERAARLHSRLGAVFSLPGRGDVDVPRALEHFAAAAPTLGTRRNRAGAYYRISYGNARHARPSSRRGSGCFGGCARHRGGRG